MPFLIALAVVGGWLAASGPDDGARHAPHARHAPQAEAELRPMLTIAWSRCPDLPRGFQDSDGGVVDNTLVTLCGFCTGTDNDKKPGVYVRGFLNRAWGLDLGDPGAGWAELPPFPGAARQELFAIPVGDALYCWGGFSYSEPYCYADGCRLARRDGRWTYEPLPALPWALCSSGVCAIGSTVYVVGGADYDAEGFRTAADRHGNNERLGAHFLAIDTAHLDAGWRRLPDCPGTPRWVAATAAAGGKVYVIGGATGDPYATVVDNWVYEPGAERWTRIRDLPIASGNFPSGAIAWRDRYILLIGGYQYDAVANPDGTTRPPYGTPGRFNDTGAYYNDVFVYDTQTGRFGRADSLPINNNLPMAVVHGDDVYLIGGETGSGVVEGEFYGHHPELCLKGRLAVVEE
ncbi:MAG: hypothetical protein JXR94_08405 [Candidatus Hydrogenedentes bacterium]|nr:hypothetical protein [Candidatus Hydrogenedentota bacterium]